MTTLRAPISINIHDAHFGIWQDNANDPTFRDDIFLPLLKAMKRRGWVVTADPETLKHYRCLSTSRRLASKGDLRAKIRISGRVIELDYWAETWPIDNTNGRQYDFEKMARMNYLDRLRVQLEMSRLQSWLETLAPIECKVLEAKDLPALQRIERRYAESWHSDKSLGRPVCRHDGNSTSKDGERIVHGATVWYVGHNGRVERGVAYYNINNMWWVVPSVDTLCNLASHEIFCRQPADLRTKQNERARRERLETELALAVRRMDFRRAELLKNILFGAEKVYLIWARDKQAYYRSNYAGYTTDTISAGRYTRAEAESEVGRVPHELEAVGPDGQRVKFERAA